MLKNNQSSVFDTNKHFNNLTVVYLANNVTMKKSLILLILMSVALTFPLHSQGLLNKVKKAVSKEISGLTGNDNNQTAPEPSCACDNATLIIDMKKFNLDYKEIYITNGIDGSIIIRDKLTGKYYILKNGKTEGPFNEDDPRLAAVGNVSDSYDEGNKNDAFTRAYPGIVVKSGEKYLIKFNGKSYGPYAIISDFAMSRSKNKFAAIVTENIIMSESEGNKLEEAMNNAKTDQERMDIAMKISQQMQNQMMQEGGPASMQPKLVSNIPGASYDGMVMAMGRLDGNAKYDDIIIITPDKILDLKGNRLMSLKENSYQIDKLFLNSANNKYASYTSGTLTFSDNTKMSDLFNPYLISNDGNVSLTYMYYSPGKDAIMQCAIPF